MLTFRRQSSLFLVVRACSVALAIGAFCTLPAFAHDASPKPPTVHASGFRLEDRGEPIGCGKAHAAILAEEAAEADPLGRELAREAMTDTDLLHCDLDIEVSNLNAGANNCTITGTNVMTIQSKSPGLTQFTFRLRTQYTITAALINGVTPISVSTASTTTRIATLDRPYTMNEIFTLTISYTGTSVSAGFGSIEVDLQGGTPVVASLSEAYYSYTWWPAKDGDTAQPGDNSDKFTIDFSITAPDNYIVPSNGLLQSVDTLSGNRKRYNWSTNYPIPSYLVSFAATNYNTWTQVYNYPAGDTYPAGSMPVEFYIYPGNDTPSNRTAWERCLLMLAAYRPVYGEYPFRDEKYGIYNFSFGGGMEHQTITGQGTFSESVTAHELGHQWWGDMITCKTWSDIWLNEGFATFTECIWEERKTGTPNLSAYLSAMVSRKPSTSPSGSVYVYPADITSGGMSRIFSSDLSYRRGGWVLHMLRHMLGDTAFFKVLADYRTAFEFKAATTDDFAAAASASCGRDLTTFFNQWVYQRGQPSYTFGWQSAAVNGQNYLLVRIAQTQTTSGYPNVFVMPVDLRATISGSPQTLTVWNDGRTEWYVIPVSAPVTALSLDPDQWILRPTPTSASYQAGPPKIISTTPVAGSTTPPSPGVSQVSIWFHTPVNATASDFSIVGDVSGARSFTLVSGSNVNPVVLNLTAPLPPDQFTLGVAATVTAANSSMGLDGEIANPNSPASLPSGDGQSGGAAALRFGVAPILGDIDLDGDVDETDRLLFVDVLLGLDTDPGRRVRSDINNNGTPDGDDVQAFLNVFPGL